jgi:hypothetical protein
MRAKPLTAHQVPFCKTVLRLVEPRAGKRTVHQDV